jgi:adenylylsulfate kinase
MILLFCGLSGAGKTTLATHVKHKLADDNFPVEIIDADKYREKLFPDLCYSKEHRFENIRRLGFIANIFSSHNILTIISAIMPYDKIRNELIETYEHVKIIYIDCPIDRLIERDTKGLYKRALLPSEHPQKISNLTGINDPFEKPVNPDLYLNTDILSIEQSTLKIYSFIKETIHSQTKT